MPLWSSNALSALGCPPSITLRSRARYVGDTSDDAGVMGMQSLYDRSEASPRGAGGQLRPEASPIPPEEALAAGGVGEGINATSIVFPRVADIGVSIVREVAPSLSTVQIHMAPFIAPPKYPLASLDAEDSGIQASPLVQRRDHSEVQLSQIRSPSSP